MDIEIERSAACLTPFVIGSREQAFQRVKTVHEVDQTTGDKLSIAMIVHTGPVALEQGWSTRARPVLGPCSARARPVLSPCSARARPVLGPCSARARPVLGPCSARARPVFGPCSARARPVLGPCSARARPVLCPCRGQ